MTTQQSESLTRIIADIGGTNIRLAIVDEQADGYYRNISTYKCADYAGLAEVLKLYISEQQLEGNRLSACLAIACPVDDDLISMTNPFESPGGHGARARQHSSRPPSSILH